MLVLSRRYLERIYIHPGIWVTALELRGNQIRIGIDAPEGTEIKREELLPPEQQYPEQQNHEQDAK